ncbi:hypothetical protein QYE76_040376 [Lolium multiflorum]|uniref:Reverse transcriptase/retrotransposon-derived protein RNase H-like domain-containing protein n=1 Tax=Lolium multiflorum TaxID=4521 RepID=A0AAD8TCP4_LOLMU|nr:hypothetical protein QYE76_040376 [Lolium multiflorum]
MNDLHFISIPPYALAHCGWNAQLGVNPILPTDSVDDGGSQKGKKRGAKVGPDHSPRGPWLGRATPCGGPTAPFASFFATFVPKPKPQRGPQGLQPPCGAENTREKRASAGRTAGEIPPGGEIDAIAIVIELDIISIIIIIISTIYTAITTAAPRHRCNNLGISMNEVRKKLFTISLSGKAAHWYKLLKNGDSIDWEDIVPLFYSKFYPPSEIHKDRNRIYNFWPHDGESIAQAWGRLKSLMLKCPIHELPGNVIIDNFYARLSFQDKTLLDTSCSGSFTRNKEEFKRDLLDRIQENTEGWENDKDRESGIIYDYKCIEAFMDTDKFRNMSATYGLDSQVVANLYKAFASHYELPKKNFDKYHEPYKDKIDSSVNKCVVIETVDNVIPEAYIEKTPFPAKMKEYSVISSAVNKSEKKPKEPEEQIKIEPAVAIVKDLVTENVEDGHIIFCEDASNIVSHPNKPKQVSVPMLSVRIGDHCYYGLCDIGASVSAIPYELYTEIMHEIGSCELEDIDVVIHLANRETISPIGIVRDVEVLCGAVLGQRVDKKLNVIHYASKTLDAAQRNYATTEKELLENIAYDPVPGNDSFPNEQLAVIKICFGSRSTMSSSGTQKDSFFDDVVNPYMNELKMHPKELLLVDGELQIKDVQGPKGEGSLEDRMEKLEQEVFNYKKMAEREVDIFHKIVSELIDGHKKETAKLWDDIFSLHDTTNKLQAQLYDVHNQNCEYENRFKRISHAASFRFPETKMSFVDGGPLPWKSDDDKDSPSSPKE